MNFINVCFLEPLKETGAKSRGNVFTNLKQEVISYELSKAHSEFSQISKFMGHSFTMFTKVGGFWWSRKVFEEEGCIFLILKASVHKKQISFFPSDVKFSNIFKLSVLPP